MDDRSERIEKLFELAAKEPPEEREAFLSAHSGDDPALAKTVAALLRAEERAGDFLSHDVLGQKVGEGGFGGDAGDRVSPRPEGVLLEPATEENSAGHRTKSRRTKNRRLGAYQLQAKIGEGGHSTVYLATRADDQFRKRVAIKLVPLAMASAEHLRRFRTERHILASLEHPSIARLHDAGTSEEGLPYFVMEYIEGEPIDTYCDRHRLSIRERLKLFRIVCEAVHFAHQNLVVHRDLKPSNILVTADGTPKLLDFGIAKLINPELTSPSSQPTLTWHRAMTPSYASPEQIQGGTITTASDIYSLGVLLYQLLAGRVPHDLSGKTPHEIERIVTTEDPGRPSLAVTTPPPTSHAKNAEAPNVQDVDRVSHARNTRPAELKRQLSGDLDNIILMALCQEPQRRYGAAEQLSEDLKRYLDGLPVRARKGTFTYRWGKHIRRRRWAFLTAAAFALMVIAFMMALAVQSSRIARERDQAHLAAEQSQEVLAFMKQVFKGADPTESKGEDITLREALDRGSERVKAELVDQPEIQASLFNALGEIYFNLGAYEDARQLLTSALTTHRRLLGENHPQVSEGLSTLGAAHHRLGEYDTAESLYRQALEISRQNLGEENPELLTQTNNLVAVLGDKGGYEEAVPLARQALSLALALPDRSGPEAMNAMQNLAGLLFAQGDYAETVNLLKQALELQRVHLGGKHPDVAFAMSSLGVVLYRQGDYEEARLMHEGALAIQRQVMGPEHPDTARTLHNLAVLLGAQGETQEAEKYLREVLELRTRVLGRDHPDVAYTLRGLGQLLVDESPAAAEPFVRESRDIWRIKLGPDHWQIASINSLLGKCLTRLGRFEEAEPLLKESYPRLAEQLGESDPQTLETLERLIELYEEWGHPERAEAFRAIHPEPKAD